MRDRRKRRLPRAAQLACGAAFQAVGGAGLAERGLNAFTAALLRQALRTPADLYIAHYPAALPAAARAAGAHGARYAYDAEDFHLGETSGRAQAMTRTVEARYLPGCAYVTAAAPGIAEAYARCYGMERPAVLLNVFGLAEAPPGPSPAGWATPGPSVYWFSQTIGPDRGLECAVRAIGRAATRPHLYLRGSLAAGFGQVLSQLADEVGAAERVHLLAPAPPSEMARLAAAYDVGLVGETGLTDNHKIALSNKQFTYLLAGVPAVMSDVPGHRAFAMETEGATFLYATESAESLAETLDGLLSEPQRLARARAKAFALAQSRFNWDVEQARLLTLVRAALGAKPPDEPCRC
jgi:glycosyltransferase involved in cell wall biosynthesis